MSNYRKTLISLRQLQNSPVSTSQEELGIKEMRVLGSPKSNFGPVLTKLQQAYNRNLHIDPVDTPEEVEEEQARPSFGL